MIEWLNGQLPNLNVSVGSSLEDLRVCLLDGTVLCQILNRLYPGAVEMVPKHFHFPSSILVFLFFFSFGVCVCGGGGGTNKHCSSFVVNMLEHILL